MRTAGQASLVATGLSQMRRVGGADTRDFVESCQNNGVVLSFSSF